MDSNIDVPSQGLVAYLGPPLTAAARLAIEARGYSVEELSAFMGPDTVLPDGAAVLVLAIDHQHPMRASLRTEAAERDLPCVTDLAFLGHLEGALSVPPTRRVLITGSAGKSVTAHLLSQILVHAGRDSRMIDAKTGFLNALGMRTEVLILETAPSWVKEADLFEPLVAAVLNLTEESGRPISSKAKEACAELLQGARFSVLGADDAGTQGLVMAVRRRRSVPGNELVPVSGGATLSDGCFAIDRNIYAIRNGRTRKMASYADSPCLLGNHFGQDAAAASAMASHLGATDDQISTGLNSFRGMEGRFDCIGAEGRIVFVDDRYASTLASTEAAIEACPEVFWIGHRHGGISKNNRELVKGMFYLQATDGSGPPVDGVVTFKDADEAAGAAIQAAQDLIRRDPQSTPVVLFSPGAPGFDRQGELFRLRALSFLTEKARAHG